jgi:heme oxygenase
MSVLDRIRATTAPLHVRLEAELMIIERLVDPVRRRALLRAYYDLYAGAEPMLEAWLADTPGLDFQTRRKADILRHDLDRLDEAPPSGTGPKAVASAPNQPFAFGFAYVLEGATLGARTIRKQVAALGCALDGLDFFDGYGSATSQRWKEFCAILERDCAHAPGDAERGAVQGFSYVRRSLLEA